MMVAQAFVAAAVAAAMLEPGAVRFLWRARSGRTFFARHGRSLSDA